VLGSGSNEVLELLIRTFMDEGEDAVICQGSFVMYKVALHAHGKKFVEVPMKDTRYDLDAMAERVGSRTKLIFVANPDNPTGTWFGKAVLERFLKRVAAKNPETIIVLDEAYFEYATDPDYPDSLRYHRDYPRLVTARTFSKIYGLAGLRLGYGVLSPTLAGFVNRARMPFNVSSAAHVAGIAALDDQEHVQKSRELNTAGLRQLSRELPALGVEPLPSQGNFVFVDMKRPAAPLYDGLLHKGVIVRPVPNYGFPNALRMTVGTFSEKGRLLGALAEVLKAR